MNAATKIFLNYAREDEQRVNALYQKLSAAGFKPWMDKKDILSGEDWKSSIQSAIWNADFFLACLSRNSVNKRGLVQIEIKEALDIWRGMLESDIYLIPVRLENCEIPESLRKFQCVDCFEEGGEPQLLNTIQAGMERRAVGSPQKDQSRDKAIVDDGLKFGPRAWQLNNKLQQQKQRLLKETASSRSLALFGFRIFDWLTTKSETEYLLGEAETQLHLQPLPIKPYCSSVLELPILQWLLPADAADVSVELYQIDSQRKLTKIWEQEIRDANHLETAQLGLAFSEAYSYNWTLSYQRHGEWNFHNGIFDLLPPNHVEEYHRAEAKLREETSIIESDFRLLQAGVLFDFDLSATLLEHLLNALAQSTELVERIPLLALLREAYMNFYETFKLHKFPEEESRALLRVAAVEEELNALYKVEPR